MGTSHTRTGTSWTGFAAALVVVVPSVTMLATATSSAVSTSSVVTIDDPGAPRAGSVDLSGTVGVDAGEVTTVLYVVDATRSTATQTGLDCSGNGTAGPEDDVNADGSVGDVLDCEIAGVTSLNRSLAATRGIQVGLVAFSNAAAAADVDPTAGTATFVPPGFTGGDPRARIDTVASSVVGGRIGLYQAKDLGASGAGTAFNSALSVALSTLSSAPAGPKWIMFLSDGQSAVDDGLLAQLTQSGVGLRTFGIGADATCDPDASLYKMAVATGESCALAPNPASLTAGLTGSRPDAVNGVTVSIKDVSVAATLDAVGGWRAPFVLGAGTYTATVRATFASGITATAQRTFAVAASPGGPAAGEVTPGAGALKGTAIRVTRPQPSRAAVPSRVTGRVGRAVPGVKATRALAGAKVLLQARPTAGAPWTTVDKDKVDRTGAFVLRWKPREKPLLQVVLQPYKGFAGSAAAVPRAAISGCKVTRASRWSVSCSTTQPDGSVARLLRGAAVVDRARVRNGAFTLKGSGRVIRHTIEVKRAGGKGTVRLHL